MPSTYSALKIQLMATGENNTTWGDVTNTNLGTAIEEAIAGSADVAFSNANVTLTLTDTNATQTARNMRLNLTGTATTGYNLIVPAIEKAYIVNNGTDGTITVKNSTGTGIAVPAGKTMWVYNNGTNVVDAVNTLTSLTLGSPLGAVSGGTGVNAVGTNGNVLTSNGTAWVSQAPATGISLSANNTWTGTQSFVGSTSVLAAALTNAAEPCTVSATAATGTINYDISTQSVLYYTSNAGADWTPNFRFSSGTSLNTVMSTGQAISVAFLVTQGATAYKSTAVQVDGGAITPKWQGGTAPSAGNASSIDIYTYTIVKTGNAAFTVFASQTKFA